MVKETGYLKAASWSGVLLGLALVLIATMAVDGVQDPALKEGLLRSGLGMLGLGGLAGTLARSSKK